MARAATFGMSGAEKALLTSGLGVLAVSTAVPASHAATTLVGSAGHASAKIHLDGDPKHDVTLLVPSFTAFMVRGLYPSASFAWTITSPAAPGSTGKTRGVAYNFSNPSAIPAWGTWEGNGATIFVNNVTSVFGVSVWPDGPGYLGVKFSDGNYGWVEISPQNGGKELTILDWGMLYATGTGGGGGGSASSNGTPEPVTTGLALLAMGAAGVMRHKRRNQ